MRVIELIDVNNIAKLDKYPLCVQTLDLAIKLKNKELTLYDLPPIHTVIRDGCHTILDGRHRYAAIKLAGIKRIKCKFYKQKEEP